MKLSTKSIFSKISPVKRHERTVILKIALAWTIIDFIFFMWRKVTGGLSEKYYAADINFTKEVALREVNVFVISLLIGYFLIAVLRNYLRDSSLWFNLFMKTLLLVLAAIVMNFFIYVTYEWLIAGYSLPRAVGKFGYTIFHNSWLLKKMPEWIVLFISTLLAIEINEKYSQGVFFNIMVGKYLQPQEERRIIMFLDLKDSTPIAEKLGHKEYFKFIRDFIFCISAGFMENDGRIYQYVGDEVVVWWPESKANANNAIAALLSTRKQINKNFDRFKRRYDTLPEYKVGLHTGIVTVGQVGIIKKDLVMSGDAINTAARIRSACTELNQKFLISKDVNDLLDLEEWQSESLGVIDLKGRNLGMELFTLKI